VRPFLVKDPERRREIRERDVSKKPRRCPVCGELVRALPSHWCYKEYMWASRERLVFAVRARGFENGAERIALRELLQGY